MIVSIEVSDFSADYLDKAAVLAYQAQKKEFNSLKIKHDVSKKFCKNIIENELEKDSSRAYVVIDDGELLGFAVGVIQPDEIWGDSGWVHLGCWGISESRKELLSLLYQKIAEEFVEKNIKQHYFQVWDNDRDILEIMSNMGFAKEQTYGVMKLKNPPESRREISSFIVRKGTQADKGQLSQFSRLIADYQKRSPCFASAPRAYLEALDEGFLGLTEDSDADVYVIEDDGKLIGYQVYYEAELSLNVPPSSMELSVAGISEKYRGRGAGRQLSRFSFKQQLQSGVSFIVTDWRCANLLSGRFWKQIGFLSSSHRLVRLIDPLI